MEAPEVNWAETSPHGPIDWDEEFNRRRPATPRPPCFICLERESLGCCICRIFLCEYCVDDHLEMHGW